MWPENEIAEYWILYNNGIKIASNKSICLEIVEIGQKD